MKYGGRGAPRQGPPTVQRRRTLIDLDPVHQRTPGEPNDLPSHSLSSAGAGATRDDSLYVERMIFVTDLPTSAAANRAEKLLQLLGPRSAHLEDEAILPRDVVAFEEVRLAAAERVNSLR